MSDMSVAAKRYAKALFEVAKEKGVVEETKSQLQAVVGAIGADAVIRSFFEHPNIDSQSKIGAIKKAVGDKLNVYVVNALQLLIERGRAAAIDSVLSAYTEIADEAMGRADAHVVSAFALSPEQEQEISKHFGKLTGKQIEVHTEVDTSLLGGVRVRIGDMLYDGSLATKLTNLEKSFNNAR